jgi:hypothetical protein
MMQKKLTLIIFFNLMSLLILSSDNQIQNQASRSDNLSASAYALRNAIITHVMQDQTLRDDQKKNSIPQSISNPFTGNSSLQFHNPYSATSAERVGLFNPTDIHKKQRCQHN